MRYRNLKKQIEFLSYFTCILIISISMKTYAQNSSNKISLTPQEQAWISDHPVLKVTNSMDFPPFDYSVLGEPKGLGIDYLNLVAKKIGINIQYVNNLTFDELLEQVKQQKIDIIHSIVSTEERKEFLNFTEPYVGSPVVNFGRIGSKKVNSLDDLIGKRIGVIKGWAITDAYETNCPQCILIEYENVPDALWALSLNNIDVFTGTLITVNYEILQHYIPGLTIIGDKLIVSDNEIVYQHRLATHIDNPILFAILKKGMAAITEEEFRAIAKEWQLLQNDIPINLSPLEHKWLSENHVITVATDSGLAPFEFIGNSGEISGMAGDYLNIIANKLNVKFNWAANQTWAEGMSMLMNGDVDIISGVSTSYVIDDKINISDSYISVNNVIFAKEGVEVYGNLGSLSGRKVAQVTGYTITNLIKENHPAINLIEVDSISEALRLVATGNVDAYISDIPSTSYYMSSEGITGISVVGETPYKLEYGIGIRNDLPLLNSAIQKALQSITELEKAQISRNWLTLKIERQTDYRLIWEIIIISSIIILIILIWNNSLRREIGRRVILEKNLILAQEVAETANKAKSSFLSNMSHEIRTPLNAIIGFSDAMIMGIGGQIVSPKHKDYLNDIKSSGEHLATVIKDILDLSKIEAGKWKLNKKEFSLDKCIEDSIKIMNIEADQKNIKLVYEGDNSVIFYGDENALKRIFINLLSNAIKFTDNEGSVRCVLSELNNTQIKIEIIDYGIGIEKERIDQVLIPFEQGHEGHELNDEGTGLGLPIVNELVKLHGGIFTLKSEVNVETRATILLPKLGRENQ